MWVASSHSVGLSLIKGEGKPPLEPSVHSTVLADLSRCEQAAPGPPAMPALVSGLLPACFQIEKNPSRVPQLDSSSLKRRLGQSCGLTPQTPSEEL